MNAIGILFIDICNMILHSSFIIQEIVRRIIYCNEINQNFIRKCTVFYHDCTFTYIRIPKKNACIERNLVHYILSLINDVM